MSKSVCDLRFATFNMHGCNLGMPMFEQCLNCCDIIVLQEHWLIESNFGKLLNNYNEFDMHAVSAMSEVVDKEIVKGRPYGGTAIVWRRAVIQDVKQYQMLHGSRCIGISFRSATAIYFVFNVYLPCSSNFDDEREMEVIECMSFIEETVADVVGDGCLEVHVIVMGDFNANCEKLFSDARLSSVKCLFDDMDLICCDHKDCNNIGYTYRHDGLGQTSFIDHVFMSSNFENAVKKFEIIDDPLNLSDHNAILFTVGVSGDLVGDVTDDGENNCNSAFSKCKHVKWDELTVSNYRDITSVLLCDMPSPEMCCTVNGNICDIDVHKVQIEDYCNGLVSVLQEAFNRLVVEKQNNGIYKNKQRIVWTSELCRLKKQSKDIHELWKTMGRPRSGIVNMERLRIKTQYKRCIKEQKRVYEDKRKFRMAQSLVDKDNCNFWKSWKSIKNMNVWHAKKHCVSGQVNSDNICQGFCNEFAKVFKNSWLDNNVSNKVHDVCCNIRTRKFSSTVITLGDVYDAVQKLKINKSAGLDNVFAECIRYAHPMLLCKLEFLFNMCCRHAYVPTYFCTGKITPIAKKANVCSKFQDFRPVASINVFAKVFEYCILNKIEQCFSINDLQLGFTSGGGCDKALFIVRSVVEYFNEYGSTVYLASLDISKAYDSVNHCVLIYKLYEIGVPSDLILLFVYWFQNLFCVVVWEGCHTLPFNMKSGVRQGGILSCWFFNIYKWNDC